jgi:hypothetical protein
MILNGGPDGDLHTNKKNQRKKRGRTCEGCVSIVTEPETKFMGFLFLRDEVYRTIHSCLSAVYKRENVVGDYSWMTI